MRRVSAVLITILTVTSTIFAQSEAGAVWMLINPGARACGMGEAGAAIADDAYATYFNPAGLGFQRGREISVMHTNWLPNLASDMYYDFIGYRQFIKDVGTVGGNIVIMNLGTQMATDEQGNELREFTSYMLSAAASYGSRLSRTSSFGFNVKMIHQHLTDILAGREKGKGQSTNFVFDVGYLKKEFLLKNLTFGAAIANIGQKISFIDVAQADPSPTNLKLALAYTIDNDYNSLTITYDVNKLLVASYPDRDVDGDGKVGGYTENGLPKLSGEYNQDGVYEIAHTDEWYTALITSWVDDWLLTYDSGADGIGENDEDGNTNDGSIYDELNKLTHNFGIEYWYAKLFAVRMGFLYDKPGNIRMKNKYPVPTFGAGLRYAGMGFDFGYTYGDSGHPRANTMHFSINLQF